MRYSAILVFCVHSRFSFRWAQKSMESGSVSKSVCNRGTTAACLSDIKSPCAHSPPVKSAASHDCGNVPRIKHSYFGYTLYFHSVLLVPRNMLCAQRSLPISFYLKYPSDLCRRTKKKEGSDERCEGKKEEKHIKTRQTKRNKINYTELFYLFLKMHSRCPLA